MPELPLVTCLCLTRNRREWLKKSIACFEAQTYEHRELLIVADEPADVVPFYGPNIRLTFTGAAKVGVKRNLGCASARGSIIAVWDDDDHSEPGRITAQVARLQSSGKSVTGYYNLKVTDGVRWWQYRTMTPNGMVIPTSLCFAKTFWQRNPFEPIQCGQDEHFVCCAVRQNQLASEPDRDLMYFTAHSGNTSPRSLPEKGSSTYVRLKDFSWPATS